MKMFSVPCMFNGQQAPVHFYIGQPEGSHHPIQFQSDWLSKVRGGTVPQEVMDALSRISDLAQKNDVSFEELCSYAMNTANGDVTEEDIKKLKDSMSSADSAENPPENDGEAEGET